MTGKLIKCVYCDHLFDLKENLKYKISSLKDSFSLLDYRASKPLFDGNENIEKANYVICPNCKKEFTASEYKLFGIMSLQIFKYIFISCLLIVILITLYETLIGMR